ncbi:MAG: copper amine oxidase N-terminal domain-containing protein [Vulcanimicrobiaceae bacterium]
MKSLSIGALAAALAASAGLSAAAAATVPSATAKVVAQAQGAPPADFGSPPTGEVPILYNDTHVYSKPDTLKQNRVLSALIRGNTILVPLRSMFEQMGATVSYDPATKTVDVSKPGAEIRLTVGKKSVIINGQQRPLDVPPQMYKGTLLVPVRVISETMGAYVLWVQAKHEVVVRYNPPAPATPPPTPPPTPEPTAPPTPVATPPPPAPTPTPTPAPAKASYEGYLLGDYIISPKVYNEFNPGNKGNGSFGFHGAYEFPAFGSTLMVGVDGREWRYPHPAGNVNVIGGNGSTFVPGFTAKDQDIDGRLGIKIADPRIYLGASYLHRSTNYGYPNQNGFGFGLEKLPDLDQSISAYGSIYYYPDVKGKFNGLNVGYSMLKYQIGGAYRFGATPVFLDFGFEGDRGNARDAAPIGFTHNGPFVGLGIKI